jgi:hypothetical protein
MTTCKQEGCDRTRYCKGLCTGHYRRLKKGQSLEGPVAPRHRPRNRLCEAGDCARPILAAGLCNSHYRRRRRGREDWAAPLNPCRKGTVALGGVRVSRRAAEALADMAKARGMTRHALLNAVVETWLHHTTPAEKWRRDA